MGDVARDEVLRRLEELERRTAVAERESAELRDEVTRLRAGNVELGPGTVERPVRPSATDRMSRSQFLRLGAAAAAAGAVGAGGALLGAGPAGALQGNMQFGNDNNSATFTTRLRSVHPDQTLTLLNESNGKALLARADSSNAIVGQDGATAPDPFFYAGAVLGTASDEGIGVTGVCNGPFGIGVHGVSEQGEAVVGDSAGGISLAGLGSGRLRLSLRPTAGPPTVAGEYFAGEQIRDSKGDLWLCVAGGPLGTWRRAALVKDGYKGGSMNLLPKPIRLYDSRSGAKLASGAKVDIQVTGTVVNGISVPAGAVGVVGNVTVTETVAPSGYLTLYPEGSPPSPATSNVNWFAVNQNLNAAVVAGLNATNGKLSIHNGIVGGSNPTHVVFDVTAFVF